MCREKYESLRLPYRFCPDEREIPQETVRKLKTILTDHGLEAR